MMFLCGVMKCYSRIKGIHECWGSIRKQKSNVLQKHLEFFVVSIPKEVLKEALACNLSTLTSCQMWPLQSVGVILVHVKIGDVSSHGSPGHGLCQFVAGTCVWCNPDPNQGLYSLNLHRLLANSYSHYNKAKDDMPCFMAPDSKVLMNVD